MMPTDMTVHYQCSYILFYISVNVPSAKVIASTVNRFLNVPPITMKLPSI